MNELPMLPVFSPSATVTASFCMRKWALSRQGWKIRTIEYPELCAVLGEGFAAGVEVMNRAKMEGIEYDIDAALKAGTTTMKDRLEWEKQFGRKVVYTWQSTEEKLPQYLAQALDLYLEADPFKTYNVVGVERTYVDHGNARYDVMLQGTSGLIVNDYKVKIRLEDKWQHKEFEKYSRSWAQYHYAWMTGVSRYYITFIILGPKPRVHVEPYELSPEYAGVWMNDAAALWARMQAVKSGKGADGAATHTDQYGDCEYAKACLDYALDPAKMAIEYVQVPRQPVKEGN